MKENDQYSKTAENPNWIEERNKLLLAIMHLPPTQIDASAIYVQKGARTALDRLKKAGLPYQDIETNFASALNILSHTALVSQAVRLYITPPINENLNVFPLHPIDGLIHQSVLPFQVLLENLGGETKLQLTNDPSVQVRGDKSRLVTALMLIMNNAFDAMSVPTMHNNKEKHLSISTHVDDLKNCVIVNITDTGHGMKKDMIENIKQSVRNKTIMQISRQNGLGLGMVIADTLLRQHNGEIDLDHIVSIPIEKGVKQHGTTIPIKLPLFKPYQKYC